MDLYVKINIKFNLLLICNLLIDFRDKSRDHLKFFIAYKMVKEKVDLYLNSNLYIYTNR